MKKNFRTFMGLLLLPLVTSVFFMDRLFCVLLFWIRCSDYMDWLNKPQEIAQSILRVLILFVICGLGYLFSILL